MLKTTGRFISANSAGARIPQQFGDPLPAKLIHRGDPEIAVTDGNHNAVCNGQTIATIRDACIEILHVPIRSYSQLERKIRQGAEALERNNRVTPNIGNSWRKIYANHLRKGSLPAYYDSLRPNPTTIAAQLIRGELINDRRLQKALGNPLPRVAVITPY